jgi:hypothetical protein
MYIKYKNKEGKEFFVTQEGGSTWDNTTLEEKPTETWIDLSNLDRFLGFLNRTEKFLKNANDRLLERQNILLNFLEKKQIIEIYGAVKTDKPEYILLFELNKHIYNLTKKFTYIKTYKDEKILRN